MEPWNWNNGTVEQRNNGIIEQWNWNNGTKEQ